MFQYCVYQYNVYICVAESAVSQNSHRKGVIWCRVREQKEGGGSATGRAGERSGDGRELQGRRHLRVTASSSPAMPRKDNGQSLPLTHSLILQAYFQGCIDKESL